MTDPNPEPGPDGDHEAAPQLVAELFPRIYPELRRRAQQCMKGEAPGHTLQATALVHEVYIKLANEGRKYENVQHLYTVVTRAMRQILVDHARARATHKRGGDVVKVALDNACQLADQHSATFLDVQDAVERLRARDPLRAQIFELDFLMGLTHAEIADAIGTDLSKVKYGLSFARAWLRRTLTAGKDAGPRGSEV